MKKAIGIILCSAFLMLVFLVVIASKTEKRAEAVAQGSPMPAAHIEPAVTLAQGPPSSKINDQAAEAIKNAKNVVIKPMAQGTVMLMVPYGPCGIIYKRTTDYLWHPESTADQTYSDLSGAIVAAESDCETYYQEQKSARENPTEDSSAE